MWKIIKTWLKNATNLKNNNFTQWKNGSVDVTITHAIMQQKRLAQSGRSTLHALYIFNTLSIFTEEPIREKEIKLECMNANRYIQLTILLFLDSQLQFPNT